MNVIDKNHIDKHNDMHHELHARRWNNLKLDRPKVESIVDKLAAFHVAIPRWALGTGGTRFGRFSGPGEPSTIDEKVSDVGLLHALNKSSGAISLHIPWDIPDDPLRIKKLAESLDIKFDAVNSNTFQDQPG